MTATAPGDRSRRRRAAGLAAGLAILLFLVLGALSGWERVSAYDWELRPELLAAGLALMVVFNLANGLGYVLIVERLAERRVPRRAFVSIYARSMLARYVPGNVLMVASRLVLGAENGVPHRVSLTASVYEQALLLATAGIASIVLVVGYGPDEVDRRIWLVALVPLGLAALHPRVLGTLGNRVLRRFGREPLATLLTVRQLAAMLAYYALLAALLSVAIWLVVRSLVAAPELTVPYVGLSFLMSFVVAMLAFVFPAGLGVRDGLFALLLARDLPGGVAIAVSTAVRLVLTVSEVVFAGLAALAARRRPG